MRTFIVGTTGQLAQELRLLPCPAAVELLEAAKVDLADEAALYSALERARPALVINAGAYTAVDRAEADEPRAFAVNARGPESLARWCSRHGACLFHFSTDYVFDGSKRTGYVESDAPSPINVYGKSKLAGELAVSAGLRQHLILRTSWVFSAHGHNFVKTIARLARERSELRVVADQLGCPTAARDLARMTLQLAERQARGADLSWGTYHYAGVGPTSWHGFAEAIVDATLPPELPRPRVVPITTAEYPTPARRPLSTVLDTNKLSSTFGISPAPWRDALDDVAQALRHA